jgi:transposase
MKKSRRTFTAEFKAKVAIEAIKEIKTVSELSQIYQVHPNLITHWKNAANDESAEVTKLKKENEELIHQIGQLSVDINWLKKKVL